MLPNCALGRPGDSPEAPEVAEASTTGGGRGRPVGGPGAAAGGANGKLDGGGGRRTAGGGGFGTSGVSEMLAFVLPAEPATGPATGNLGIGGGPSFSVLDAPMACFTRAAAASSIASISAADSTGPLLPSDSPGEDRCSGVSLGTEGKHGAEPDGGAGGAAVRAPGGGGGATELLPLLPPTCIFGLSAVEQTSDSVRASQCGVGSTDSGIERLLIEPEEDEPLEEPPGIAPGEPRSESLSPPAAFARGVSVVAQSAWSAGLPLSAGLRGSCGIAAGTHALVIGAV